MLSALVLTGCEEKEKETKPEKIDYSEYLFASTSWTRDSGNDIETLRLKPDGTFTYYCSCGNPVNDSDLCETYVYDDKTKEIKLDCFETTEEMDEYIIKQWNSSVNKNDEVYILGDLSFLDGEKTNEYLKRLNGKKYLIKDDKLQYCVDIYAELADIMKKYNDLNKDANDIVKREAFHDLVARILRSRGEKNKYSYLELTVGGKTYNVGKKLEELIDRVTSDGIIKEPSRVLSSITKRMDFIQLFFSCKHLFTKELVNASERYPDLLRVENAPLSSKLNKDKIESLLKEENIKF